MARSSISRDGRFFRKGRVRARVSGSAERPRLSVFRSLRSFSVQAVDDIEGKTLCSAFLRELTSEKVKNSVFGAHEVGKLIAKKCHAKGITRVVFDRNGYRYHGRVRAAAEGMREGGLIF